MSRNISIGVSGYGRHFKEIFVETRRKRRYFDVIDGVHVAHAVLDDFARLAEPAVRADGGHRVPLNEHVAAGEQLDRLERRARRPDEARAPAHEALALRDEPVQLDHVARDVVLRAHTLAHILGFYSYSYSYS